MPKRPATGTVYLIHFKTPYKHARHYLGYTENFNDRMEAHRKGQGSRLLKVIMDAGIEWEVVRTWTEASRRTERKLKNRGGAARLCPLCRGEKGGPECRSTQQPLAGG